jgi:hypothetical protein
MGRRGMYVGFWWESQKERDYWKDQDVGGVVNIRMDLGWEGVNWIHLARDRGQWSIPMNTVMNPRVT